MAQRDSYACRAPPLPLFSDVTPGSSAVAVVFANPALGEGCAVIHKK
ncbi:hypothetical protein LO507_002042 [Salmonella enterica subsp. arizonae serovar 41:z4,z23:-]|nr:hypothetical protein [Salmonella enterica subsp. arizonae serovar 41:z4,z23:-]